MSLTIHHLQYSQSERLVWLAEELHLTYNLTLHQRAPIFSPPSIKSLHPLGQAPIIQHSSLVLAESGACIDYMLAKCTTSESPALVLPPSHPDFAQYLYWYHFANSNLQPTLLRLMQVKAVAADPGSRQVTGTEEGLDRGLRFMDERLRGGPWLAGEEFTVADIMTVFTLTTMRTFYPLDLSRYENVLAYLKRVSEREGYRRARAKGDPEMELMIEGRPPRQFLERLRADGKL